MARLTMVIDLAACVGCAACAIACKTENQVAPGRNRLWIRETELGTFPDLTVEYRPEQCMQCENSPCVRVCPTGANHVDEYGIVDIHRDRCVGCKYCILACPYGARYVDKELGLPDKCDLCKHRIVKGRVPACVETCPTACRYLGDLDDPGDPIHKVIAEAARAEVLLPQAGTVPRLYYLNTPVRGGLVENRHKV